jgi:hypothetical protein
MFLKISSSMFHLRTLHAFSNEMLLILLNAGQPFEVWLYSMWNLRWGDFCLFCIPYSRPVFFSFIPFFPLLDLPSQFFFFEVLLLLPCGFQSSAFLYTSLPFFSICTIRFNFPLISTFITSCPVLRQSSWLETTSGHITFQIFLKQLV